MLSNFHLAALTRIKSQSGCFRIPMHRSLQNSLSEAWERQLQEFSDDIEEIELDMGYTPEVKERFRLTNFSLSEPLAGITSQTISNEESIAKHEEFLESIKAIVAFCRDKNKTELLLFQNFTRSSVIKPGHFLFLARNTYESANSPALALDNKLAAVLFVKEKKLLFHSFRVTNTFLSLADYSEEASEEEIREVLKHKSFAAEDIEELAANASQWFRKRFAMLKRSQTLEDFTPEQIKKRSEGYDVIINLKNGKIVFPSDFAAAKRLLQFLNEELYRGPITDTLYETNSKRKASK
jgi:hypothetical protein